MAGISTYLSKIILNINDISSLIKRCRLVDWMKNEDTAVCGLQDTHFIAKDMQTEGENMENNIPCK